MDIGIDERISESNPLFCEQESGRYITRSSLVSLAQRVGFAALAVVSSYAALVAVGLGGGSLFLLIDGCLLEGGLLGCVASGLLLTAIKMLQLSASGFFNQRSLH